jgi:hypothetical protein
VATRGGVTVSVVLPAPEHRGAGSDEAQRGCVAAAAAMLGSALPAHDAARMCFVAASAKSADRASDVNADVARAEPGFRRAHVFVDTVTYPCIVVARNAAADGATQFDPAPVVVPRNAANRSGDGFSAAGIAAAVAAFTHQLYHVAVGDAVAEHALAEAGGRPDTVSRVMGADSGTAAEEALPPWVPPHLQASPWAAHLAAAFLL